MLLLSLSLLLSVLAVEGSRVVRQSNWSLCLCGAAAASLSHHVSLVSACEANRLLTIYARWASHSVSGDARHWRTSPGRLSSVCPSIRPSVQAQQHPELPPEGRGTIRSAHAVWPGQTCTLLRVWTLDTGRTSREPGVMDGDGGHWGRLLLLNVSTQHQQETFFSFFHVQNVKRWLDFTAHLAPCLQPPAKPPQLASFIWCFAGPSIDLKSKKKHKIQNQLPKILTALLSIKVKQFKIRI